MSPSEEYVATLAACGLAFGLLAGALTRVVEHLLL